MGVSKVNFGGETLVDLTGDTVNEQVLLSGYTAHGADGEPVDGAVTAVPTTTSLAVTQPGVSALDGTVGKTLNDKGEQMSVYVGDDGNLHFRNWSGADTVIPFSGSEQIAGKTDLISGESKTISTDESMSFLSCASIRDNGNIIPLIWSKSFNKTVLKDYGGNMQINILNSGFSVTNLSTRKVVFKYSYSKKDMFQN